MIDPDVIMKMTLTPENFHFLQEAIIKIQTENVLNDFRSLECCVCSKHFGFQNRKQCEFMVCSASCATKGDPKAEESENEVLPQDVFKDQGYSSSGKKSLLSSGLRSPSSVSPGRDDQGERSPISGGVRAKTRNVRVNPSHTQDYSTPEHLNGNARNGIMKMDSYARHDSIDETDKKKSVVFDLENKTSSVKPNSSSGSDSSIPIGNETALSKARLPPNTSPRQNPPRLKILSTKKSCDSKIPKLPVISVGRCDPPPRKTKWTMNDVAVSQAFGNKECQCFISFAYSSTKFTIVATEDELNRDKLQQSIADYSKTASYLAQLPEEDEITFAYYLPTGCFYRAQVISSDPKKRTIVVLYIDYGDTNTVRLSDCLEPCAKIMKDHPIYGVMYECTLQNAFPPDLRLSSELLELMEGKFYVPGVGLNEVGRVTRFQWKGELFLDKAKFRSWNIMLDAYIQKKFKEDQQRQLAEEKIDSDSMQVCLKSDGDKDDGVERPNKYHPVMLGSCKVSPHLTGGATVLVTHVWDYSKVHIVAKDDSEKAEDLHELVQKLSKTSRALSGKPVVGEIVLAPYADGDGVSYDRAVVLKVYNENVVVNFLDFGDSVDVKWSVLKEVTPEIADHPIYGVALKLDGIRSGLPDVDISSINDKMLNIDCQIEVCRKQGISWTGRLWIAKDRTWNDEVKDFIREQYAL